MGEGLKELKGLRGLNEVKGGLEKCREVELANQRLVNLPKAGEI